MKKICVFCGSSNGRDPKYLDLANEVGSLIGGHGWGLVYGGGKVGLMGAVANAVMAKKQDVIGVIPKSLVSAEVAHTGVTALHVVGSMHERKKMMYDLSDAFLIIPGGMGTLDEMFEIITWAQLKYHSKPIYILNEFGFYNSLIEFINHSSQQGFIRPEHLQLFKVIEKVEGLEPIFS
jgi:uncharacterized protein (TIGR00730 family)